MARLGGDEFVVLRPRIDRGDGAEAWAEQIRGELAKPVDVDGLQLAVTCSIGVVESAADDDISQLLIDGDLALLRAKRDGRNRVVQHSTGLRPHQQQRIGLAEHIHAKIAEGDIIVRYQPVFDLATGAMVGAEALARLAGPAGTELTPAEFLPHLEALGLLGDLARRC